MATFPAPIKVAMFLANKMVPVWANWFREIEADVGGGVGGKADKVVGATAGNIATLDGTGNLQDGGQGLPAGTILGTADAQTVTNKTINADNNTISNLVHGAEVDNPSSGVHGVTGSVVGTTDSQTLSAKTLTSPVLNTGLSGTAFLDEDNMASDSATKAASQQSVKAYIDSGTVTMTNKTLTSPVLNTQVTGTAVLDEDTMASDSAVKVATQQSIKAYVDNNLPKGNAIINGDFNIWQAGTSFAAIANGTYVADMFMVGYGGVMVATVSRDTDVPTQAESNHQSAYSLKVDCTTIDASIDAADAFSIFYKIEGYNFRPFVGKAATLTFWVKSVKTGIYCVAFRSSTSDRSYVAEYTINAASTWEKKTITLTFNYTGGTWDYTNGIGLCVVWALATGSNYQGVADTWNPANNTATSNQVNFFDNTANDFWLAQVQFELGSAATVFEYRQFGDELQKCQRYYRKTYDYATAPATVTDTGILCGSSASTNPAPGCVNWQYSEMRTNPTITGYSPGTGTSAKCENLDTSTDVNVHIGHIGANSAFLLANVVVTANQLYGFHAVAAARL